MDRKFLEGFGLEKEQINQILDQNSLDIGKKKDEGDSRVDAERLKLESLQQELEAANKTIKDLQKANKDNEALQSQIEQYKQQIEQVQENARTEKIKMSLNMALSNAGAINAKAVMPFIDMEKISVDKNGEVIGINDQVAEIQKNNDLSFLFKSEQTTTVENPDRGGYEPLRAETQSSENDKGLSLGARIGEMFKQEQDSQNESSKSYWDYTKI